MANCKAGHTCRFVATEEVFQQIDTTTVEMTTQVNYFNESYDYTKDFEVSKAYIFLVRKINSFRQICEKPIMLLFNGHALGALQ